MKQPPTILHSLLYNIPKTVLINYEMGKREIKSDSLPPDKEKKTKKKKLKSTKNNVTQIKLIIWKPSKIIANPT